MKFSGIKNKGCVLFRNEYVPVPVMIHLPTSKRDMAGDSRGDILEGRSAQVGTNVTL